MRDEDIEVLADHLRREWHIGKFKGRMMVREVLHMAGTMNASTDRDDHQHDAPSQGGWRRIETAIEAAKNNDGWISIALFAIEREWGWEMWVGQCDDGAIWLGRLGDGSCFETDRPTHWMPLPAPPGGRVTEPSVQRSQTSNEPA